MGEYDIREVEGVVAIRESGRHGFFFGISLMNWFDLELDNGIYGWGLFFYYLFAEPLKYKREHATMVHHISEGKALRTVESRGPRETVFVFRFDHQCYYLVSV